jgi:hypothetical protein
MEAFTLYAIPNLTKRVRWLMFVFTCQADDGFFCAVGLTLCGRSAYFILQ